MLETLLKILSWDWPSPEILLEEDGDLGLDWNGEIDISIAPSGMVAWAILEPRAHGSSLDDFKRLATEAMVKKGLIV